MVIGHVFMLILVSFLTIKVMIELVMDELCFVLIS